jgi:2-polyprenyl-6-methoxyphenol hydroxylase-like FAD-dependent oxidoreductase
MTLRCDVVVIGAGVAGVSCAQGFARRGAAVVLIDRLHPMPPTLKAEKMGGDAVRALVRLGFDDVVDRLLTPLRAADVYFGQALLGRRSTHPPEGAGAYDEVVNGLRGSLDGRVSFLTGRVTELALRDDGVRVVSEGGDSWDAALCVVATGEARKLLGAGPMPPEPFVPHSTLVAAFTIQGQLRPEIDDAVFHSPVAGSPIAYVAFFRFGAHIRANVFCPGDVGDVWQSALREGLPMLASRNARIAALTEGWRQVSTVATRKASIGRVPFPSSSRVFAMGDAAHVLDPSAGEGITLALLETELLMSKFDELGELDSRLVPSVQSDRRYRAAVRRFFRQGEYIHTLYRGSGWRSRQVRWQFILRNMVLAARERFERRRVVGSARDAWREPGLMLHEIYGLGGDADP